MPQIQTPESKGKRFLILIASAATGLFFGWLVNCYELLAFMGIGFETHGAVSAVILVVSLPTLIFLWLFRTHDTRQQIQKTQEAINANLFGVYLKMLLSKEIEERCNGLLGLIAMKKKDLFVEEIDAITQQNLNLKRSILKGKDLSGMNFSNANFRESIVSGSDLSNTNLSSADLCGADLSGAMLMNTNLEGAKMSLVRRPIPDYENYVTSETIVTNLSGADMAGANLSGAKLMGADLTKANLTGANLKDAEYSKETEFPEGFNPQEAGMKRV